jgi:fatty acid desaturase
MTTGSPSHAHQNHADQTHADDHGEGEPQQVVTTGVGSDYAALSRAVRRAGLFNHRPGYYTVKIGVNLLLLTTGWVVFAVIGSSWWQLLVAVFLAVMFVQTGFIGHDAGHHQISASKRVNELLGRLHGNLLVGLSFDWWISKHNRHHAHPNQIDRDPDIQSGALTFTDDAARARRGMGAWLTRRQAWLFFPMLTLEGFNLHIASVRAMLGRGGRPRRVRPLATALEGGLLAGHVIGYLTAVFWVLPPIQAVCFIAVQQGLFGVYLGCSFAPNHKGMAIFAADEKIDYLRRQVLTSRNIRGNRLIDWTLGGLNYQIEHHLFPFMPRPNLARVNALVRAHCAEHGIAYHETGLLASYGQVLRHLHTVGAPLRPELEY